MNIGFYKSISTCSRYIAAKRVSVLFRNMSSQSETDKGLEHLKDNPYFDKYAKKIAKVQQRNPEILMELMKKKKEVTEKKKEEDRTYQAEAKAEILQSSQTKESRLSDIMNMDMIQDKTKEEIEQIWKEYHKQKDYIYGVMESGLYERIFEYGRKYPLFLLPLPRKQCYEFFLSQFQGNKIYMTSLLWYQAHKENAPECLTLTHYTEFKDNKGIVLMRGELDLKYLKPEEAQCLANELQLYYTGSSPQRLKLLDQFNNMPDTFKHSELIDQLEKVTIST